MRRRHAISLALIVATIPLMAQSPPVDTTARLALPSESAVDPLRLAIVAGGTAGAFVYGHVLQSNIWWKGARSDFHFEWSRDWRYSLGADKLGHAWFPYAMTHTYDELFRWASVDSTSAIWSAASLALAYQTYIEVRDGFSAQWGFSWGDFGADVVGSALPVAQRYVPPLRSVGFKISFFPSDSFRAGSNRAIIDDYESTYHWLTLHVIDVVPDSWRQNFPAFVDLALGHSVKELDGNGGGTHEVFLALDWNLDGIEFDWWGWRVVRGILRHYHLPSPAIRLYPGPLEVGIHF